MASVALAGRPRVNDNLQTCPTVYKSGTLVELAPLAFFCQSPDASLNHGLGLSRDISNPTTHRFAKRNGFRESFSNTQCLVCISDAFWKSVSPCHVVVVVAALRQAHASRTPCATWGEHYRPKSIRVVVRVKGKGPAGPKSTRVEVRGTESSLKLF